MQRPVAKNNRAKKPGIFNNAVFSKIVTAADHPSVKEGVQKDLKTILKKPPQNDSHRWNHAPQTDSRSSEQFDVKRIRQPGRGLSFLKPQKDEMVVRTVLRKRDEASSSPSDAQRLDLFNSFNDIVSAAGTEQVPKKKMKPSATKVRFNPESKTFAFKDTDYNFNDSISPEGRGFSLFDSQDVKAMPPPILKTKPKIMPIHLPVDEIVSQTAEALPKLPLREGHPLTYSSMVTDFCKKAIMRQRKDPSAAKSEKEGATSSSAINQMNMTVREAARENTEMLSRFDNDNPLNNAYGSESPLGQSSSFQFPMNIDPTNSTPSDAQGFPFYSDSLLFRSPEKNSFDLSIIKNQSGDFVFDSPGFFDE